MRLEQTINVPRDDDLVPVRLATEPRVEIDDLAGRVSVVYEVPRMDQNVAVWHKQLSMRSMRVA